MDAVTLTLVVLLIGGGLLLLVAELFLPTGGILGIAGAISILAGIALPFYYGDSAAGVATLVIVVALAVAIPRVLDALDLWDDLMVKTLHSEAADDDATIASMPVIAELELLRGRNGRAVSPLRPCGVAEFDGKRIDVLTEGMMVDEGSWVRCIDVRAGKVVVRPVDAPTLSDLENLDLS